MSRVREDWEGFLEEYPEAEERLHRARRRASLLIKSVFREWPDPEGYEPTALKQAEREVNALGSNLLNVLFVVGVVSMMHPLTVTDMSLGVHFPVMLGFAVLLFPLAWTGYRITRLEGSLMVAGFLGYMSYLVYPYV